MQQAIPPISAPARGDNTKLSNFGDESGALPNGHRIGHGWVTLAKNYFVRNGSTGVESLDRTLREADATVPRLPETAARGAIRVNERTGGELERRL